MENTNDKKRRRKKRRRKRGEGRSSRRRSSRRRSRRKRIRIGRRRERKNGASVIEAHPPPPLPLFLSTSFHSIENIPVRLAFLQGEPFRRPPPPPSPSPPAGRGHKGQHRNAT